MSTQPTVSPILATVDAYRAEDLDGVTDGRLDADLEDLDRALVQLEAERLRRLRRWDQRGVWARDGSKSPAAALARKSSIAPGTARDQLRVARRLADAPVAAEAFARGDLTYAKARLVAALGDPDESAVLRGAFAAAEAELVTAARGLSVRDTAYVVNHFSAHADPDGHERKWNDRYKTSRLHLSESFDGWGHLDAYLDPEQTQLARHALDLLQDRLYRRDQSAGHSDVGAGDTTDRGNDTDPLPGPARRRAEAFAALCQLVLDDDPERDRDLTGIARPVIGLLADADLLTTHDTHDTHDESRPRRSPVAYLTSNGVPVPRSTAERHLCDATVVPLVTSRSVPLALGRATRTPSVAQLRALAVRDGGCVFPGCATPARFTQAHHLTYWRNRGPTDLDNLALLCRHHHRLVHEQHWRCALDPHTRRPVFTDPHGKVVEPDPTPLDLAKQAQHLAGAA